MQCVYGGCGEFLGSAQRAVLSWLNLARVGPGEGFVVGKAFGIQGLVSEMELFLHDGVWELKVLGQI